MVRVSLFLFFIFAFMVSKAQNNLFFGHYMFNQSFYNPGWVGSEDQASISFLYRNQWVGYSSSIDGSGGAPQTQMLSFVTPIQGLPIKGAGINVINDNLGAEDNIQVQFSGSYEFNLRFASLQIGIMPGIYTKTINANNFDPNNPFDDKIPDNKETQSRFNLGVGLYYMTSSGNHLGLSVINLIEPSFDFGIEGIRNIQRRNYQISGGTKFTLNNRFTLLPTAIVRTNLTSVTFDVGSIINYKEKLWTGLSYRLEESLILYLGYNLLDNKLRAGYSFDYVVHNTDAKKPTSHEIYLRYNLPDFVLGGRKAVKTPRFTF